MRRSSKRLCVRDFTQQVECPTLESAGKNIATTNEARLGTAAAVSTQGATPLSKEFELPLVEVKKELSNDEVNELLNNSECTGEPSHHHGMNADDVCAKQQQTLCEAPFAGTSTSAPTPLLQSRIKRVVVIKRSKDNRPLQPPSDNRVGGKQLSAFQSSDSVERQQVTGPGKRVKVIAPTSFTQSPKCSEYNFEADEVDLQESDSDEDGYSDIDFDNEDEVIEVEDSVEEYDPVWTQDLTNPCLMLNYDTASQQKGFCGNLTSHAPVHYYDTLLGSRTDFFIKLAASCNTRVAETSSTLDTDVNHMNVKPFTAEELQIFVGICMQMSSLKLTKLEQYWHVNGHYGFIGIRDKMSLNRFEMLLKVLNFDKFECGTSNSTYKSFNEEKRGDKFSDLRPLLNFFNHRIESIYKGSQAVVLNEPIIYWKGKFNWLNDMRTKFRCNAVMLHFLTERSGLLLKIVPDMEGADRKHHARNSKLLVLRRLAIAMEALKSKLGRGHIVYASKYYGSYALALELAKAQTYCTGVLDSNCYGNSKEVILTKLNKGTTVARYADFIMMGKYRHRDKSVYFYTSDCRTFWQADPQTHIKVVRELASHLPTPPNVRSYIFDYQLPLQRTEIKWDTRVMTFVLDLIVLNAYLLYTINANFTDTTNNNSLMTYAKFRQEIIKSLLNVSVANVIGWAPVSGTVSKFEIKHMPKVIPQNNGKTVKRKCQICRKGGLLTYSKYCCESCPGIPGLCETPCFKIWHDQLRKSTMITAFGVNGEQLVPINI